jgi:hypothetical protein
LEQCGTVVEFELEFLKTVCFHVHNFKQLMYIRGAQILGNMFLHVKFCIVLPDTHWFSVWNLVYVTIVAPGILKWMIDFLEYMLTSDVYECTLAVVLTTGGIHEKNCVFSFNCYTPFTFQSYEKSLEKKTVCGN